VGGYLLNRLNVSHLYFWVLFGSFDYINKGSGILKLVYCWLADSQSVLRNASVSCIKL
jgi:hypothetical protein